MIRILTDSAADITIDQAKQMDVDLVSLIIHFDDCVYCQEEDGGQFQKFYTLLEQAKQLPTTSQPAPEAYAALYRKAAEAGEEVLVITLSSKLSGTYQSALMAKELVPDATVYVVDSLSAIIGQRLLVEHAVRLRQGGMAAAEIARIVTELRERVVIWGMIDKLIYLAKGGRMPKSMATLGQLLHVKPIIAVDQGALAMVSKARSYQAMLTQMVKGPEMDRDYPVFFGYTATQEPAQKFMAGACEHFDLKDTGIYPIGGLIGSHIGPGCIAVAYVAREPFKL